MAFNAPFWLILLLPLWAYTIWMVRQMQGLSRSQRVTALTLRLLICTLIVAALAGPELRLKTSGQAIAFVLDLSDSVPSKDQQRARQFVDQSMKSLGGSDVGSVVVAGAEPLLESAAGPSRPIPAIQSKVNPASSNLAAAVRLGIASLPGSKNRRVVLLTDGNETDGDLVQASEVASAEGITLDVVSLGSEREKAEAFVAEVTAPSDARLGGKSVIRARVVADRAMPARLTLDRDGVKRATRTLQLNEGENLIVFEEPVDKLGLSNYRVTLETEEDGDNRNNIGLAILNAKGPSRTLVLESGTSPSALYKALQGRGILVSRATPGSIPVRLTDFAQYDAILINDLNATNLTDNQMKAIQTSVRDSGSGFAMVGGEDSFLPGGYYATPIADALPVDLNIRKRKDLPSTSILIMVDCSGSMSMVEDGLPKLELAKKAAEVTSTMLGPMDRLGVAGSSDGIEFVVPMGPLVKEQAIAGIRKLAVTGGGIYIGPSVSKANQTLTAEDSKVRHLLLLADGADSTDWRDSMLQVTDMRKRGITTSVIAFGKGEFVPDLRRLAALGGGRFYLAEKARQLPAIFSQDAAIVSRSAIEEGAFYPKQTGSDDSIRGLGEFPALLAYCLTDSRPLARNVLKTHKDDPLLARWQYGLGTSLAFTSDAHPRWARQWVGWEGYDVFWSQLVRGMARRATQTRYEVEIGQESGIGTVLVKSPDERAPSSVRVAGPDGEPQTIELEPSAPGEYVGRFQSSKLGSYVVSVVEDSPTGSLVQVESVSRAYPAEYQAATANLPLLQQAVTATGGRLLKDEREAVRPASKAVVTPVEIWFWCLLAGCLLWPFDVASRRLVLKGFSFKKAKAPVVDQAPITRLKEAKDRTRSAPKKAAAPLFAPPPTEEKKTAAPKQTDTGAAAERLLELKRKRSREAEKSRPKQDAEE